MSAEDHVAVDIDLQKLRAQLTAFARKLAAERWYSSPSYETTVSDSIAEAVAKTKSDVGEALLEALGVTKDDEEGR